MTLGSFPLGTVPLGGVGFHATFDLAARSDESSILFVASQIDEALIRRFQERPEEMKVMNRRLFEELIAELFHGFGYAVELMKRTHDGGKDIVAIRQSEVNVKFLIQCKRPDVGHSISVAAVRELLGVKVSEGATKGILATTESFTRDAKRLFEKHEWELEGRDYDAVRKWIDEYLHSRGAAQVQG